MIMLEKVKEFFAMKYRIVPTYAENKKVGFIVQRKGFWGYWTTAPITKVSKVPCYRDQLTVSDAFFLTEEEAKDFVNSQKTIL